MDKKNMFSMMEKATKTAFDRTAKLSGQPSDPDLMLYQSLEPKDFQGLMETYGETDVVRYIQKMESRRIMGGNNGRA